MWEKSRQWFEDMKRKYQEDSEERFAIIKKVFKEISSEIPLTLADGTNDRE